MKIYLNILIIFGIFIAAAVNLPSLTRLVRKRDIETTAKEHILARLKEPSSVKWNAKNVAVTGKTTLLTYDFTGIKDVSPVREIWTFEFDNATKDLLRVEEKPAHLNFGGLPPAK